MNHYRGLLYLLPEQLSFSFVIDDTVIDVTKLREQRRPSVHVFFHIVVFELQGMKRLRSNQGRGRTIRPKLLIHMPYDLPTSK